MATKLLKILFFSVILISFFALSNCTNQNIDIDSFIVEPIFEGTYNLTRAEVQDSAGSSVLSEMNDVIVMDEVCVDTLPGNDDLFALIDQTDILQAGLINQVCAQDSSAETQSGEWQFDVENNRLRLRFPNAMKPDTTFFDLSIELDSLNITFDLNNNRVQEFNGRTDLSSFNISPSFSQPIRLTFTRDD